MHLRMLSKMDLMVQMDVKLKNQSKSEVFIPPGDA